PGGRPSTTGARQPDAALAIRRTHGANRAACSPCQGAASGGRNPGTRAGTTRTALLQGNGTPYHSPCPPGRGTPGPVDPGRARGDALHTASPTGRRMWPHVGACHRTPIAAREGRAGRRGCRSAAATTRSFVPRGRTGTGVGRGRVARPA